jgi:hypothetical protein
MYGDWKGMVLFMGMKFRLVYMSFNSLKYSDRDVRTSQTIPGMGGYQLLEIRNSCRSTSNVGKSWLNYPTIDEESTAP